MRLETNALYPAADLGERVDALTGNEPVEEIARLHRDVMAVTGRYAIALDGANDTAGRYSMSEANINRLDLPAAHEFYQLSGAAEDEFRNVAVEDARQAADEYAEAARQAAIERGNISDSFENYDRPPVELDGYDDQARSA